MKFTCFLLLILATAIPVRACINESAPTFDEEYRMNTGQSPVDYLRERMRAQPSSRIAALESDLHLRTEVDGEFVTAERDALRDIYAGNYGSAIETLQALEALHPGSYSTAANLGTAYELAGDNQNALHWISECIKRNADSHQGTEWLHKQILEAKIAMESDPDYLKTNHIAYISESAPRNSNPGVDRLVRALHFQLGERMLFVKPTDPVVADLLYGFAMEVANTRSLNPALELLQLAREYGYHDTADLDEKLARYRKALFAENLKHWSKIAFMIGLLCLLFLCIYVLFRSIVRRLDPILNPADNSER